jgi:adenylate cyclase
LPIKFNEKQNDRNLSVNTLNLRFLFIHILVFFSISAHAQLVDPEIDSLTKVIASQKDDSTKVNTLITLGNYYLGSDLNAALTTGNQAKELAELINYQKGLGNALKLLGIGYAFQANYREANLQFQAALDVFESINFKDGIANILNNLGSLNYSLGDDSKSIEYHLQSLKIAEEINNKMRIATNLNNIGTVYSNKEATRSKALEYYLKALVYFKDIEYNDGIATASVNIGEDYFRRGNYDSALNYFKTSANLFQENASAAYALTYIAEIYADRNDFTAAMEYHNQALDITNRLGAKLELAQSLLGLAKTQHKLGQYKQAIESCQSALKLSKEIGAKQEIKQSYEALSQLYATVNDFKNAFTYESLLTSIKDTLYNTDEGKKIQQLQFNFDIEKKEAQIQLQGATIQRQKIITYAIGISGFLLLVLAVGSYNRYKYVRRTNKIIKDERDRSKELLLNILPEETARELETNGSAQPRYYEQATVLFTDFKGFSSIAGKLSPQELVAELNDYFIAFDEIMGKFNLEKIKTIGDAYMCAGGIPVENNTHPLDAVHAGLAMQEYMMKKNEELKELGKEGWELRIGIHTGPVVAGVVGKKKYAYDIWGDTVNIASRMESNGEPGKVNISASTYQKIKNYYQCLYRGKISAKNIGEVDMYFIDSAIQTPANSTASLTSIAH